MKLIIWKALSPFLFIYTIGSYFLYTLRKKNSNFTHFVFRKAFVTTNGRSNDLINGLFPKRKPKASVTGIFSNVNTEGFVSEMNEKGYYIFPDLLPAKLLNQIESDLKTIQPKRLDFINKRYVDDPEFPEQITSPRYQYMQEDLEELPAVKALYQDESMINLATAYLTTTPIMDLLACWWSYPYANPASRSSAAQLYHFDMDRLKFIKFFVYLTDVSEENGPHCYIESSHHRLPVRFHEDRRFTDEEVKQAFPAKERILTGPKGKVMAVDTRGLHKGLDLKSGHRLILQVEFANSLYGKNY